MPYIQIVLFSYSVLIAGVIALVRLKQTDQSFYPFILCIWIAGANEILSTLLAYAGATTIINNNIYVLCEALLITWQFNKWGLFLRHNKIYNLCLSMIVIAWVFENMGLSSVHKIGFYFRVFYAFTIILMSVYFLSGLLVNEKGRTFKNAKLLICLGYIIFFTFKIITEAFWFYGLNVSNSFSVDVYTVFIWINLFVNLLFALAVICIPLRPRYISF